VQCPLRQEQSQATAATEKEQAMHALLKEPATQLRRPRLQAQALLAAEIPATRIEILPRQPPRQLAALHARLRPRKAELQRQAEARQLAELQRLVEVREEAQLRPVDLVALVGLAELLSAP
jgi:hypothetical protein